MRICTNCKNTKPKSAFGKNEKMPDGIKHECAQCSSKRHAEWYKKNRSSVQMKHTAYRSAHKKEIKKYKSAWMLHGGKEKHRSWYVEYRLAKRLLVLGHYTGGTMRCQCPGCRVRGQQFLTIDHLEKDGSNHRKKVGHGVLFYLWIIRNRFPKYLRVLCWNCNCASGMYGACHVVRK